MKKTALLVALSAALVACQQAETTKKAEVAEVPEKAAPVAVELTTLDQKAAYSIGQNFSKQMTTNFDSLVQYGVKIDKELVIKGITDGFAGKGQFDDAALQANMQEFQTTLQTKMAAQQEKVAAEAKVKAVENKKVGEAFQVEYAAKEGVKKTDSGLLYSVMTKGEGKVHPKAEDTVRVHYKGTFIDGKEFDSSYGRGEPAEFGLSHVIKGWTEGLQLMTEGDKFEFVIPADIAYGEADRNSIPGNSTLVFEVELLAINPSEDAAK